MIVDIWSDVRCPFCYIGKRKFEQALAQFEQRQSVQVHWHSFELDPQLKTQPALSSIQHLATQKGITETQAEQMVGAAVSMGQEIGVQFNFSKAVVANSFHAHRLIQLAKRNGLGDAVEEALFKAHFEEGINIDDKPALRRIGETIGLKTEELDRVLFTDAYAQDVRQDERDAHRIGVRGVPFFVFNNRYALSGAQPSETFLEVLQKTWQEIQPSKQNEGSSCDVEGCCD